MTQEDLAALNAFIAKYPYCSYNVIFSKKYGYKFEIYLFEVGTERSEYCPTLSEAITDVVAQMEAVRDYET